MKRSVKCAHSDPMCEPCKKEFTTPYPSMSNSTTDHRYLVKPGYVRSRSDGDLHYIGFAKLVGLYGVPLIECLHFDEARLHGYTKEYIDGLTVLEPQESGDYEL